MFASSHRCELVADEIGEPRAVPAALAQERMGRGHGLDAPIEGLDELVHGAAALAGIHRDHRDPREDVLHAVVELRDQHILALFRALCARDVAGQPLEEHEAARRVELGSRGFLEPDFLAVGTHEAEGERIGRSVRTHPAYVRLDRARSSGWTRARKPDAVKGFPWVESQICAAFLLRRDAPVTTSHSNAVTAPAVSASCSRASLSMKTRS